MTTLGTATILIHGDDRQLQAVLAKIPQSMERVAAAVQSVSVSAFGKAGTAAGKSFASAMATAYAQSSKAFKPPSIPAPSGSSQSRSKRSQNSAIEQPVSVSVAGIAESVRAFNAAGVAASKAFGAGMATAGASGVSASLTAPIAGVVRSFNAAGNESGTALKIGVTKGAEGIAANLASPIQSISTAFSAAGTSSGNAFGLGVSSGAKTIPDTLAAGFAAASAGAQRAGAAAGKAFSVAAAPAEYRIFANIAQPLSTVAQEFRAAGNRSGAAFNLGAIAGVAGLPASISNPFQSISTAFSAAGTASGNAFGIGFKASTAGISAGIGTQIGSAAPAASSAGTQAGNSFAAAFRSSARAVLNTPLIGGAFSAGQNLGRSIGNSIGQSIRSSIASAVSGSLIKLGASLGDYENYGKFEAAARKVESISKGSKATAERSALATSKRLGYGVGSTELLESQYQARSSGVQGARALDKISEAAGKLSVITSGELKSGDATVTLARLSAIAGERGLDGTGRKPIDINTDGFQKLASVIAAFQDESVGFDGAIAARQIGKLVQPAAAAQLNLYEQLAQVSQASIKLPYGAVTAGAENYIKSIVAPGKKASEAADSIGLDLSAKGLKSKGLIGFSEDLKKRLDEYEKKNGAGTSSEILAKILPNTQGRRYATAILDRNEQSKQSAKTIEQGSIDTKYKTISEGGLAQSKAFQNSLKELDIQLKRGFIGDSFAAGFAIAGKAIASLASGLESLNRAYQSLSPEQRSFVNTIGGVAIGAIGLVASIAAVGVVVGAIAAPLSAAAALAVSFAGGLGAVAVVAAPIAIPIAAASAAVFGLAKAFGATDSQAFTAALTTAGIALAALFGPAIVSSAIAGATAIATSLSTVAVAAWAAAAPFLPFIAIAAAVGVALYALYKVFQNPVVQKWAKDTWAAISSWATNTYRAIDSWSGGFLSKVSQAFSGSVSAVKAGYLSLDGTSAGWARNASTIAATWGANFSKATGTSFDSIARTFQSGFQSLLAPQQTFTNASATQLNGWWTTTSAGFVNWISGVNRAIGNGWNSLVNSTRSFVVGTTTIVANFVNVTGDYFGKLTAAVVLSIRQWFPWLGSIGTATNKLGLQIRAFKDLAIGAFNTTVRAGQDLGRGIVRAFDDVVNSIKGMLDWVGQIPANFNRAIDSINIFKDRSREAQAQSAPQPAPTQQTQPQPSGKPNYGSNLGASSKSSANDGGVLVASSDLSGLGINFSKSVSESGANFKNAIAQAARISEVSSPIANIRSAQDAATFQPPLAMQRPEAYRNRKGKGPNIHGAVDYPAPVGTPVLAAFDGEVTYEKVPYATKYGKYTGAATLKAIDAYGNEIKLRYFHLGIEAANKINTTEAVKAGQIIGRVGRDGEQGGNTPHLDLKAYVNGKKKLDPRVVLQELLRQQGSIASSSNSSSSSTGTTSPIKVVYPDGIDRTDSKSTPRLPAPQPKPSPQQPKFIEPIVKTESQTPDSASTRSEVKTEPGTVNVSTEVNIPPSPDRPLLGSIAPTDERFVAPPQLPAAILGTNEGIEITKFPPLEFTRIPTVKLEGLGSKPIASAAPIPSTAPAPNASVTVGASIFTPGGGGINGPEKDVKGKRLTRNDKAIAIPGLANGGIENVLPYGTIVQVTNPATGKSTEAAVRDAGPFVGSKINRQADLTDAVAKAIGFKGTGNVELKVVKLPPGFDPNKMYQIGDTKKFGSDKKSNVIPGPSISGGGSIASSDVAQSSKSASRDDKLETLQTRYERALADREEIERIGARKASGRKGTNKSEVQTRYNQAYSTKLEKARRREEDAKAALEKARSTAETSNPLDDLKAEVDRIVSISAVENAKTDKAVADPKSPITTKEADRLKAGRLIAQFNALTPLLERAKAFREVNPGNADVAEKVRQIEAAIYALGKDMEEAKTKVSGQTLDAAKERIDLIFANASKRETQTSLDLKSGKLTQAQAKERDRDSKVRLAKELATQEGDIARFATVSTRRDEVTGFNELLTRIKTARAEAIAAIKTDTQEKFGDYISNRIEAGQKQIEELANARKAGSISEAEEAQKALDVRIATSNELQNTIDKLTYLKALSDNADESKIFDEQIRKINAYYAETAQAKNEYYANVFKSREESILKTETKRTTEVNRADELNPDRSAREIEQSEKTLLVIRQQSVAELKKLKVEIENYRDSLTEADLQTRASLNEQIDRIRAKEVEVAKATQEADKNAVRLRETTKAIATTGQDSFKSLFLDAANGFKNIGSIVDNLINKIADIGLNAIFDSLIYNNKGGGGIFGDILGFLGFNSGGEVPRLTGAGAGAMAIANFNNGGTVGKAFGAVAGLQAALRREGAGGVPIVAKAGEEVLTIPDAQLYRSLVGSGEWDRIRQISNYASGGTIGAISNSPMTATVPRLSANSASGGNNSAMRGTLTVDRINNVDYVSVEQLVAYVDIKMPEAARAGAALSTQNLSNTNYRQQNGLNNR